MHRLTAIGVACLGLAGAAFAAAPAEETVQGLYEGAVKAATGEQKFEARVVACGKGALKVFIRQTAPDGKVTKIELDGKIEGDAVKFAGKAGDAEWAATYADGTIKGTAGAGTVEMKKVVRESPAMGAKPPAGAVILLGDKNFDGMVKKAGKDGKEPEWKVFDDGGVLIPKGGMNSKQQFEGNFKLHVEFKNPFMPDGRSQGRGNSGVFLPNGSEIQVLDSFGMVTYTGGGCGGLYKYKDPDAFDEFSLASAPPLQWQTYDVEYRVPMKDGKPDGKPRVTVFHNGIKIHDNAELSNAAKKGGISLQDHGNAVQYRNIWLLPLGDK